MLLYHRTNAAKAIIEGGFRDGSGHWGTDALWTGVWLSDRPLDCNEGAWGDDVLEIDIPEDEAAEYEWVGEGKGYREFLIPGAIVNRYGPPEIVEDDGCEVLDIGGLNGASPALSAPGPWRDTRCSGDGRSATSSRK